MKNLLKRIGMELSSHVATPSTAVSILGFSRTLLIIRKSTFSDQPITAPQYLCICQDYIINYSQSWGLSLPKVPYTEGSSGPTWNRK